MLFRMTTPVPTRFTDAELAMIDELVASGIGDSRSAVIRR
jgi:Arc/MetJ-type ribon-helix-helix transcriptional regulator